MATTIELKNSVTTGNSPSTLAQGEVAINITDKKVWVGNASSTPIQLIGAGASMSLTSLTTSSDASISGLTVGKGGGSVATNTALGVSALASNSTGYQTTAVGFQALNANTGNNNTAFGTQALVLNTSGTDNTAVGLAALGSNTTGAYNTSVGELALNKNTTASNNTAVGYQAGYSNTTGTYLSLLGYHAGYSNTTGSSLTAVGYRSADANTTGAENSAIGMYALLSNTTGQDHSATGYGALQSNTTGSFNTANGAYALNSNTTASNNTAVGYQAGYSATGTSNTFIGYQTGQGATPITSGTYNVHLGFYTSGSSASVSNEIVISSGSSGGTGKGASTGYINANGGGTYQGNNSTLWSITSDQRLKKNIVDNLVGLDAITKIQVRNFEYRLPEEVTELSKENAINIQGVQLGPIAQELAQILPDCVKTESTGVMSVDASNITWHLINAVKELNAKVTALEAKLGA